MPCCAASRTTAPHRASISVTRPASRSSHIDERAVASICSMRWASRVNSQLGRRSTWGSTVGDTAATWAGGDARARHHAQRLGLQRGNLAAIAVEQFLAQGQVRQRMGRVVQVQQQLAPLHGADVGWQHGGQACGVEDRGDALGDGVTLPLHGACGGAVHMGAAQHHVVKGACPPAHSNWAPVRQCGPRCPRRFAARGRGCPARRWPPVRVRQTLWRHF